MNESMIKLTKNDFLILQPLNMYPKSTPDCQNETTAR